MQYARETLCCFLGNSLHFITQLTPCHGPVYVTQREKRANFTEKPEGGGISLTLFFTPSPLAGESPQVVDYSLIKITDCDFDKEEQNKGLSGISEEELGPCVPVELKSLKVIFPWGIFLQ